MTRISGDPGALAAMLRTHFPGEASSGLTFRTLMPPASPLLTLVYLTGLADSHDLERLVLTPLSAGAVSGPPAVLARSGRLPAPRLDCAATEEALIAGLLDGLVAIHIAGYAGVLMAGSGRPEDDRNSFGYSLPESAAAIARQMRRADLRTEFHTRADGSRCALLYLKDETSPAILQAVRTWSTGLSATISRPPWWRLPLNALRLPPATEAPTLPLVAGALTGGYIAVLQDDRAEPLVAPTTLSRLFAAPGDMTLSQALRRTTLLVRVLSAAMGLTLGAWLVAMSSYHHSLIPGPFLVAMATSRSNLPLPVIGEILLVALVSDVFQGIAQRTGGRKLTLHGLVGLVLAVTAFMQVGVLGALSGTVGIVESAIRATLLNADLRRVVRLWRYLFIGAAAGLGVYGMSLLMFLLLAYLAEERVLGHPMRMPPTVVSR